MAYETKPGTGSAFKNKRKSSDSHPDLTGEINIDGNLHWLNVWKKKDKNGDTYISVGFKPKEAKDDSAPF